MFKSEIPIDHREDVCGLCGSRNVQYKSGPLKHTRDDCLQHIKFIANAAWRRSIELEKTTDRQGKLIADCQKRIILLESQIVNLQQPIEIHQFLFETPPVLANHGPPKPRSKTTGVTPKIVAYGERINKAKRKK